MELTTTARVQDGRLKVRNWERIQRQLSRCRDGEFVITIQRKHATRSLNANAYYWGVVIAALADHTGYTSDEMHEVCKAKFLPKTLAVAGLNGEIQGEFVIGGSSAKLDALEFGDYVRAIKAWAESLGLQIPEPEGLAA